MSNRELVVLGTASQVPTRHRNHNGYFLRWDDIGIMVDPGEDIEQLLIAVDGPPAGSPVTVTVGEAGSPVRCVHRIRQTGTAEVILHQLNVVESLGSIEVQSINFIDVGGHVNGPIIVTNSTSDLRGIRRMDVAGDILGDIIVADGTIRELVVLGDIGSPQEIVRIEVGIGLWNIDVRGDINATVDLCATGNAGFLHRLRANDFNGTLSVDRLDRPAGEDEPPVLSLTGWLSGMWSIAGSLQDQEAVVELPPGGLRGQVIVNVNRVPLDPDAERRAPDVRCLASRHLPRALRRHTHHAVLPTEKRRNLAAPRPASRKQL